MEQKFKDRLKDLDDIKPKDDGEIRRKRGTQFESLINDIFQYEGILRKSSYHTSDNSSEQIDSAIRVREKMFLVEVKWKQSNIAASELFAFIGKVENKFVGTIGIFISREPLEDNFINALHRGRRQSVIVLHGKDIDDWFNSDFKFEDYVDFVWEVVSYNNNPYISVRQYLDSLAPSNVTASITASTPPSPNVSSFISSSLLKTDVPEVDLLTRWESMKEVEKQKVYEFIIKYYSKYRIDCERRFNYDIVRRLDKFIEDINPPKQWDKELAREYYTHLVPKELRIYGMNGFVSRFTEFYDELDMKSKNTFEEFVISEWGRVIGNWNSENTLTDLIEPIWDLLREETREKIIPYYLLIFTSEERGDRHSQKKFAVHLVQKRRIEDIVIKKWLVKRLTKDKELYEELTDGRINFLAQSYSKLARYLNMTNEDWEKFVNKILK